MGEDDWELFLLMKRRPPRRRGGASVVVDGASGAGGVDVGVAAGPVSAPVNGGRGETATGPFSGASPRASVAKSGGSTIC